MTNNKIIAALLFLILFSCAPKKLPPGVIMLTQEELDNPITDTLPHPVLNSRCPYNDSTSAKPVHVKGYKRKNKVWVHSYKRSLPTQKA